MRNEPQSPMDEQTMEQYTVRQPDGTELGPASLQELLAWADAGRVSSDDTLISPDGTAQSVLLHDTLARTIEAQRSSSVRNPGRLELISGLSLLGVAVIFALGSVLAPGDLNLVRGKGHHSVNQVYWWLILGIAGAAGGLLLLRGLRERTRSALFDRLKGAPPTASPTDGGKTPDGPE